MWGMRLIWPQGDEATWQFLSGDKATYVYLVASSPYYKSWSSLLTLLREIISSHGRLGASLWSVVEMITANTTALCVLVG